MPVFDTTLNITDNSQQGNVATMGVAADGRTDPSTGISHWGSLCKFKFNAFTPPGSYNAIYVYLGKTNGFFRQWLRVLVVDTLIGQPWQYIDETGIVYDGVFSVANTELVATVLNPPVITQQPVDTTVTDGAPASFTVQATGVTSYQWQYLINDDWLDIPNGSQYSGTTTNTLLINSVTLGLLGAQYRVILTNTDGSTTSNIVTLTVVEPEPPAPVIPANLLDLYNNTWKLFADMVPKFCGAHPCKSKQDTKTFNDAYDFLTAANFLLDVDNITFGVNLNAASILLNSLNNK